MRNLTPQLRSLRKTRFHASLSLYGISSLLTRSKGRASHLPVSRQNSNGRGDVRVRADSRAGDATEPSHCRDIKVTLRHCSMLATASVRDSKRREIGALEQAVEGLHIKTLSAPVSNGESTPEEDARLRVAVCLTFFPSQALRTRLMNRTATTS